MGGLKMTLPEGAPLQLALPIITPRLALDAYDLSDAHDLAAARADSWQELCRWLDWAVDEEAQTAVAECRTDIEGLIGALDARTSVDLTIRERETGLFVAHIGLYNIDWRIGKFTLGYWVRSTCAGRGYITEACNALLRYCFGYLKASGVGLGVYDENLASLRVVAKLGFEHLQTWPDTYCRADGSSGNTLIFHRTSTEGLPPLEVDWQAAG
jgi:RimJ/RimL family protein N-acetyltransferase